jgi:hypothetical protein
MRFTLGAAPGNIAGSGTETRYLLVIALLFVSSARAQPGTFTATGNMITPRFAHTATLLPNGKVLIAGGNTTCFIGVAVPCVSPDGAELYDPATGAFAAAGSMTAVNPKGGVLLPDGRVLFAGNDANGATALVELYDSSAESFTVTGHTATLISVESVTLLNDGKVLITGVESYSPSIYGAEIHDPAAGTFTAVANWSPVDPTPLAVLIDGRVFLEFYEDDAELLDPLTGTFGLTGGLCCFDGPPRASLLLNGNVLFTGGNDIGGSESSVESYDPAAGTLTANIRMSTPRDGHTSTLLPDGTVLLAGGAAIASIKVPAVASAELYDPATGSFFATDSLGTGRSNHAAVLLSNGQVLVTGGSALGSSSSISGMSSAEIYTPPVLMPAPVLFSLSGDGCGQGAVWHATTGQVASPDNPAIAGEALSMYTTSLVDGGVVPPQVAIGGRLAEVRYFGGAPGYPGYNQVNFLVPNLVAPGPAVSVRLNYLTRPSNEVTIGVQ